jgi:hypothetical protein
MAIRKIVSRSIQDATVAAADFGGSVSSLSVSGASALNTTTSNTLSVNAISTTLNVSANKVFVYDTRKDSDGGAWRKRVNQTSWYNETLNTATRGSRRDFPAVAVIVYITSTSLTIYDGDDPTLPMWMVLPYSPTPTVTWYGFGSNLPTLKGLTALNGIIAICNSDAGNGSTGTTLVKFLSDGFIRYTTTSGYNGNLNINISQRALTSGLVWDNTTNTINRNGNDIAMTVLPNAPIDAATGLPIPTVAVATDGGIYVIHNNGTVNSIQSTDATEYNFWRSVGFTKDYKLIINGTYSGVSNNIVHVCDIPYVNYSGATVNARITPLNSRYYHSDSSTPNLKPSPSSGLARTASTGINSLVVGTIGGGLNFVAEAPETVSGISSNAMVAHVQPTYNTGWMPGNIKGAFLSDTNAETLGTELVTNGTFTSNVTGWTNYGTSITWSSGNGGCAIVTPAASAWNGAGQTITTVVGRRYIATCTFISGSGYYSLSVNETNATYAGKLDYNAALNPSNQSMKVEWTATGTTAYLTIDNLNTTNTNPLTVDNVTCKLSDDDRSVVNKGLMPYGSVTKAVIATGNDLVAYSGWTSGYLEQVYNSNLDYGTGDWYYGFWLKTDSTTTYGGNTYIFERSSVSDASNRRIEARVSASNQLQVYASGGVVNTAIPIPADTWCKVDIVKRGTNIYVYVNGIYISVTTGFSGSFSDTAANLVVGNRAYFASRTSNLTATTQLALFKTSASAPTEDQIAKMYNDEKLLFQTGAKACLYGTSVTVTDVVYDDSTDLLHVGTSAGRSVFDGLRRVDNTTTAVSASISASNGLVAEQ